MRVRIWRCVPILASLAVAPAVLAQQASGTITGTVTESGTSRPVANAQVFLPRTRQGGQTNDVGAFTIRNVTPGAVTVRVQMIGFEPVEKTVTVATGAVANVPVTLTRTAVALSEVVVTATGETRKRELGNSIATIDTAQVARQAASNPQEILAGSTPGVTVLANSGQPGAGGTIRLRGVNSVSQGNGPLIYVDGVRIYSGNTPNSGQGRQFVNPLNDIAAEDIDHIEVVEGPSATTLYGTEASGGVLQIFTKRGTEGQHWNASATAGVNNMGHVGPTSDPTGQGVNECRGPNLVNGAGVHYVDTTCPANGSWLHNGPVQRLDLSVRGGASSVNYFVSGTGNSEEGVLPVGGNRDQTLRANISFLATSALHLDVNSSIAHRRVTFVPDGNNAAGALLNLARGPGSGFRATGCSSDPAVVCLINDSLFRISSTNTTDHFTTGGTLTYQPTSKLSGRVGLGYDNNTADIADIRPLGYILTPLGSYGETLWNQQLLSADASAQIRQPVGSSWVSTTSIGGQSFDSRLHSTSLSASNFAAPGTPVLTTGSTRTINSVSEQRVINAGLFGQEVIGWRDVAFLNLGLRVDGNSAFGKSFGLQRYPKASLSYVLSDESFWPIKSIESLKLRAALGESGKAPGAFDAVRTWNPVAANNGQPAFATGSIGNPDLGPERTRETELGFDASALNGRLGVSYTYYSAHTIGALIPVQQTPSLGFSGSQLENVGQLFNHGNTLQLTGYPIRGRNLELMTRLNLSTFASRAGDIGGQPITISTVQRTSVVAGLPVPSYYGKKILNPNAFADPDTVNDQFLGAVFPTKIISPNVSVRLWNRLTLDALGEWQLGGHNLNAIGYVDSNLQDWQPCYATQAKLKAFAAGNTAALNDVTALERAKCTLSATARDLSFWVEDASFFKLRSVSLTFDLPRRLSLGSNNASLTFAGRNLFKQTSYDGTDPEVADQTDNTFSRRDYYVFPTYRTFLLTLRLGF
jgi:TonB-dependent starch-binding outer membrane protein SusC